MKLIYDLFLAIIQDEWKKISKFRQEKRDMNMQTYINKRFP